MNVTDYDIMTDDYNNTLSLKNNCTNNENIYTNILINNTMRPIILMFFGLDGIYII